MAATFACPKCGHSVSIETRIPVGATIRCPGCKTAFAPEAVHKTVSAAFATLGLPIDATSQQVKEAFRDLAQVWHPDRFTHNPRLTGQAEVKMKELNEAYSVLRDYLEGKRQQSVSGPQQANVKASSDKKRKTPIGLRPKLKGLAMRMRGRESSVLTVVRRSEYGCRLIGWMFLSPFNAVIAERVSSQFRRPITWPTKLVQRKCHRSLQRADLYARRKSRKGRCDSCCESGREIQSCDGH